MAPTLAPYLPLFAFPPSEEIPLNLQRHHRESCGTRPRVRERYLRKDKAVAFGMVKPSETRRTLKVMADDLFGLVEGFRTHEQIAAMHSYQLLVRLLKEQCIVETDATTRQRKVVVKSNKEVPSDSLQNPSDPDATYDGHKGKGYQVQLVETCQPVPRKETQEEGQSSGPKQPSLIT